MEKSRESILLDIFKAAIIFLTALVLLSLVSFFVVRSIVKGKEVEVPNVIGKSFMEAFDILSEHNLNIRKEGYKYSADLPENHVVEQRPIPNQKVKSDREIKVFLSRGTEAETVPRVIGQTVSETESILKAVGLKVGSVVRVHSDDFPQEGTVIAHTPPANATIERGSKVNLLVSQGSHSVRLIMPDLGGMKLQSALEQLEALGLKSGRVNRKDSPVVEEPGMVLEQIPLPNDRVQRGTLVDLVVSSGGASQNATRIVVLRYKVLPRPASLENPPEYEDSSPRHVKIVLEHEGKTRTIVDKMVAPGSWLERPVQISGRGIAKIYVDDMESPIAHKEL